jgi:hypothetical protein
MILMGLPRVALRGPLTMVTLLHAVALVACGPDEPRFGDPGGIIGKSLPNEVTGASTPGGVFGAPYDANAFKPATTMVAAHTAKQGPPAGDALDCLSCHSAAGPAAAKPFSFGGRVVSNGAPAADVDVIVIQDGEKIGPVKSDADGFFWSAGPAVKANAKTYVRKGATEKPMGGGLPATTGGSCDNASCHVPGKQGKIFI